MAKLSLKILVPLCLLASSVDRVFAEDFLLPRGSNMRIDLMGELEGALGSDYRSVAEARLCEIKDALRPGFATMPKNAEGRVDQAAVRYLLHRLFVELHGWSIKGLDAAGEAWGSGALPTQILVDRLPSHIHGIFQERLERHGLDLQEVAVMATTLEKLVHGESEERLVTAFRALNVDRTEPLSVSKVENVVEVYMTIFLLGMNNSATGEEVRNEFLHVGKSYPGFDETMIFARDVKNTVLGRNASIYAKVPFSDTLKVVEKIGEQFGQYQDKECTTMKESLVAMDRQGSGRVKLHDFYRRAASDPEMKEMDQGSWQFSESPAYLRQLGALDDTNPDDLSVIIPNYVTSQGNCIASSAFYSVCCMNECEVLLSFIEHGVAAPSATPKQLADLVTELPSETVSAPRKVSKALRRRLVEIAQHHDGRVPLHSRLFAQWMHHAYPRECPFPHTSGTTKPVTMEEWYAQTGEETTASLDQMRQFVGADKRRKRSSSIAEGVEKVELPWSSEEEVFVVRAPQLQNAKRSVSVTLGGGVLMVVLISFAFAVERSFSQALEATGDKKFHI